MSGWLALYFWQNELSPKVMTDFCILGIFLVMLVGSSCVNGGLQSGCLDVSENFQNCPEQSACPLTTPALKNTQDKLILQSSALSKTTRQKPQDSSAPSIFISACRSFVLGTSIPPWLWSTTCSQVLAHPSICFPRRLKTPSFLKLSTSTSSSKHGYLA